MLTHGIAFIVDPQHHKKRLDYEIANAHTSFEEYYFKWNIQCQAKKLCYDRNCVRYVLRHIVMLRER